MAEHDHAGHTHEDEKPKEENWAEKLFRDLTGEPTTEERMKELAKTRDLFSVKEAIGYADQEKVLKLGTIGYYVKYKPLRIQDKLAIAEITEINPNVLRDRQNRLKVKLILNRCYPDINDAFVDKMSANVVDVILTEYDIEEDGRFLLPLMQRRSDGLNPASKSRS